MPRCGSWPSGNLLLTPVLAAALVLTLAWPALSMADDDPFAPKPGTAKVPAPAPATPPVTGITPRPAPRHFSWRQRSGEPTSAA